MTHHSHNSVHPASASGAPITPSSTPSDDDGVALDVDHQELELAADATIATIAAGMTTTIAAPARSSTGVFKEMVQPPRLTRVLTFADGALERAYESEMLARYPRRLATAALLLALVFGASAISRAVELGDVLSETSAPFWIAVGSSAASLGAVGASLALPRLHLTLGAVEGVTVSLLLCFAASFFAISFHEEQQRFLHDSSCGALGGDCAEISAARRVAALYNGLLRALVVPVVALTLLPMQAIGACTVSVAVMLLQLVLVARTYEHQLLDDVAGKISEHSARNNAETLESIALVVLLLGSALLGRLSHIASHRAQFHSHLANERASKQLVAEMSRGARADVNLKESETSKQVQMQSALAAKQARSRLIRIAMHDLRSPLLAVSNAVSTLSELEPSAQLGSAEVVDSVHALAKMSKLMQHIVSDMMDFERIDSGRLVLVPAPFFVGQLLEDACMTFAALADSKGVVLKVEHLPPDLVAVPLIGDSRRLQQCTNNGLSNAIKFSERGGTIVLRARAVNMRLSATPSSTSPCAIHPSASSDQAAVAVSIVDCGIGMSHDELRKLRRGEAFVGQGQLQGVGGTGLGLTITRQLLQMHDDSELHLDSPGPGLGFTFELRLKLWRALENTLGEGSAEQRRAEISTPVLHDRMAAARALARSQTIARSQEGLERSLGHVAQDAHRTSSPPRRSIVAVDNNGAAAPKPAPSSHSSEIVPPSTPTVGAVPTAAVALMAGTGGMAAATKTAPRRRSPELDGMDYPPGFSCLYVDDDRILQKSFVKRVFERMAAPYAQAWDGREAVERIVEKGEQYDIIVMDNQMPRMGGILATRALRAAGFAGMIIGMTGDPRGSPERDEFDCAGLDMSLDKDDKGVKEVLRVLESCLVPIGSAGGAETPASAPASAPATEPPDEHVGSKASDAHHEQQAGATGETAAGLDAQAWSALCASHAASARSRARHHTADAAGSMRRRPCPHGLHAAGEREQQGADGVDEQAWESLRTSHGAASVRARTRYHTCDQLTARTTSAVVDEDYTGEDDLLRSRPHTVSTFMMPYDLE